MAILQAKIVSHLENWVFSWRATFQAKKTYIIHFTWNKKRIIEADADKPLVIEDQRTFTFQKNKILSVILDSKLRYLNHSISAVLVLE